MSLVKHDILYLIELLYLVVSLGLFFRSGSISRGFRGEFRQWQIIPGTREASPVMANQFSVKLYTSNSIETSYMLFGFPYQEVNDF